jgi:hypothetical protein
MKNQEIARLFAEMGDLLEIKEDTRGCRGSRRRPRRRSSKGSQE